jgi:nucleoside-diphosphate-sugar epimerase
MDVSTGNGINASTKRQASQRLKQPRARNHILVIGGAGYLGSVLVRQLLDRAYSVTVMDALMYGDDSVRDLYGHPGFDVVRGDLRDVEALISASHHADAVVHLGALVGDPACAYDEQLATEINLEATRTIAAVARGLGIERLVFASTCGVYGASDDLLDEDSPLGPVSLYARTKLDSEAYLLSLNGSRFKPVVLRFGTFYGASPRPRFDLVVNLLVAKAVTEGEIIIFGGSQWRPFIHVADGARAIIRCLEAPARRLQQRVFNVGSDRQNHTLTEIARIIAAAVPDARVELAPEAPEEANYRVSFARIQNTLGFRATRTVQDGVRELKEAIEQGAVGDITDSRYSNIKSLATGDSTRALEGEPAQLAVTGGVV